MASPKTGTKNGNSNGGNSEDARAVEGFDDFEEFKAKASASLNKFENRAEFLRSRIDSDKQELSKMKRSIKAIAGFDRPRKVGGRKKKVPTESGEASTASADAAASSETAATPN